MPRSLQLISAEVLVTGLLEVRGITVAYGEAVAIEDLSFHVGQGEFVTIIGANGAGKTTLLNAIMGVLPVRTGSIHFEGKDIAPLQVEERVAAGIALVPERRELFSELSVEDNLRLGSYLRRNAAAERLDQVYAILPKLAERRAQFAGTLSGGEQQMVAVGRALMAQPRILMLDEPSTGLAPKIIEEIFEAIGSLKKGGVTGILVEQNAALALEIADRGFVLEVGSFVASGAAAELRDDPRVTAAYLGTGDRYREAAPAASAIVEGKDHSNGS